MNDNGAAQAVRIPGVLVDDVAHQDPSAQSSLALVAQTEPTGTQAPSGGAAVDTSRPADAVAAGAGENTAAKPEPAEKKKPAPRGTAMAAGGRAVEAPAPAEEFPVWPRPMNQDEFYVPEEEFDATDLAAVNREMNRARARIFRVSQSLRLAQRTLAEAQSNYDRQMRRQMVTITGGTEASRRALAEINCEHLETRVIVGKQIVEEWRKRSMDARDDLKAIENIAHNVRAQMDIR